MFDIDELLSKKNQREAFSQLMNKNETKGPDDMLLSELKEYWELNKERILEEIKEGSYEPGIIKMKEIVNSKGKRRSIASYSVIDRYICKMISLKLIRYIEPEFLPNSFAYQKNKGIVNAVEKCKEYINDGNTVVLEIDIKSFFDNISLIKLESLISDRITDEKVRSLIHSYLYCKVDKDGLIEDITKGVIQGNSISPCLSNLYLHSLDVMLEESKYNWVRYADDINIYFNNKKDAFDAYKRIKEYLNNELELQLNNNKSGVYKFDEHSFLGYDFYFQKGKIDIRKHVYQKKSYYSSWHSSAIEKMNNEYHIVQSGVLNKKDYSFLFENEEEKHHIPVEVTDQINIYGNITLTSNVLQTLSDKNIRVAIVDKYGNPMGHFLPHRHNKTSITLLNQCRMYLDPKERLKMVRRMELAGIHNIRTNLKYYNKKNIDLSKYIEEIEKHMQNIRDKDNIEQIMLEEAAVRKLYYESFNKIIRNKEFIFTKRTKNPPKDPLNTLISFCNTLLYNELLRIIYKTTLDMRIGIVHASNRRITTLNLDFADLFKPIIVDRIIFTLVNTNQLKTDIDFKSVDNGGIYLNDSGKKIVISAFENKLSTTININNKEITYRKLMEDEINKYLKYVNDGFNYKPFKYY